MDNFVNDWEDFEIPRVTDNDYGLEWPDGTPQIVKELTGFKYAKREEQIGEFDSAFIHGLRICQLLWEDKFVSISRKGALNTYFLDVFHDLCSFENMALTGPASSAKTYTSAIFMLICFYSLPDEFAGLISTTSGTSAERRVWADVKMLHRNARWEAVGLPQIGEILEYLKLIVYNPALIAGENFNIRDFRNGILVIPVGADASGDQAIDTIMGTKNEHVTWMIDEGPAMPTDIMAARSTLESNPYVQFVMVGNANIKTDPHARACEPKEGWGTVSPAVKRWKGRTLDVLFLHGEHGPNDIYGANAKKKKDLPYPRLANRFSRDKIAYNEGQGDIEAGKNTLKYWRFGIGFWMGSDTQQTVLSEQLVKSHDADRNPERWGVGRVRVFAGADPSFVSGGDLNALTFFHVGMTVKGRIQCFVESASIEISPKIHGRKEYADAVAEKIVELCLDRGMQPQDFGIDVSNDGGITAQAIEKHWKQGGIQLLSSMEPATMKKYATRVTQYWFSIRDLMATGAVCGFNIHSNYAKDLFERRYTTDQSAKKVEKKKDLKKRIHRSPDCGDSFSYGAHMVLSSGMLANADVEEFKDNLRNGEKVVQFFRIFDRVNPYNGAEDDEFAVSGIIDED